MEFKMKFDTRSFDKDVKNMNRAIKKSIKEVIDFAVIDLRENYQEVTVKKLDVVRNSGRLRPYTKNAVLYKKAKLKDLVASVYMKKAQYEYLKNTIDEKQVKFKSPKKENLIVPDKDYRRRRSYGQPQKKGGIKRAGDFWLPNRHGGYTLFERNKRAGLRPIWHTTKYFRYDEPTLPYYADMFRLLRKKEKYYTGRLFRNRVKKNLKSFKKK